MAALAESALISRARHRRQRTFLAAWVAEGSLPPPPSPPHADAGTVPFVLVHTSAVAGPAAAARPMRRAASPVSLSLDQRWHPPSPPNPVRCRWASRPRSSSLSSRLWLARGYCSSDRGGAAGEAACPARLGGVTRTRGAPRPARPRAVRPGSPAMMRGSSARHEVGGKDTCASRIADALPAKRRVVVLRLASQGCKRLMTTISLFKFPGLNKALYTLAAGQRLARTPTEHQRPGSTQ